MLTTPPYTSAISPCHETAIPLFKLCATGHPCSCTSMARSASFLLPLGTFTWYVTRTFVTKGRPSTFSMSPSTKPVSLSG